MSSLADKVIIVTGASSGIGEAATRSLVERGCNVLAVARRKDRLHSLLAELNSGGENRSVMLVGDVSHYETAEKAMQECLRLWGRVDCVVNNAGVMHVGPVDGADIEHWQQMIETNLLGLMYFTRAALPIMKINRNGHFINISSVSGRVVTSRSAVYSATKFAVNAFSDGLRQEVSKEGIRVTVIEPGAVATELTDHIACQETKESVKSWVASMKALRSEDIARAVIYALEQPPHVNTNEILIRPIEQNL